MGVPSEDCLKVAELIGVKTMLNEFVAFERLGILMSDAQFYRDHNGTKSMLSYLNNGSAIFNYSNGSKLFMWGMLFVCLVPLMALCILNYSITHFTEIIRPDCLHT